MTRFGRIRRRPDHWASPHERARARAAERLDGPIGLAEATFLEGHLAECSACAAVAAAYDADRQALRSLRGAMPEPPRDLWARTAAAIERESSARGRAAARRRAPNGGRVPLGALSGVAVIAVIVGVSAVSTGLVPSFGGGGAAGTATRGAGDASMEAASTDGVDGQQYTAGGGPGPTPFAVGAGDVAWVQASAGMLALNNTPIDLVCPTGADCAVIDAATTRRFAAVQAQPETLISSPDDRQMVVVSRSESGGQEILVVDLPQDDGPSPAATADPITPSVPPTAATDSASPSGAPASPATGEPPASAEPPATATPPATAEPTGTAAPSEVIQIPSPTPGPSAAPTAAASLAIAAGVTVVGESAAFSPDGHYFAFTARAADGSTGPDVFLWSVGSTEDARPIIADGVSTFASWAGGDLLISRPANADLTAEATEGVPETAVVDPATGEVLSTVEAWRPAVDPTGRRAIAWMGTIGRTEGDGQAWQPLDGSLELRAWPITDTATDTDGAAGPARRDRIADHAVGDFDVRWDDSGEWVAVWVADPADPTLGRLSLYHVDPERGRLDQPKGAPKDVSAGPGFSIGKGRLAWVTPRGQGGEGSRVQVVAWNEDGVGSVETRPADDIIIVR